MITIPALSRVSGIRHAFFTRHGGVSEGIYASKNCGFGSGDARENVARNRARCMAELDAGGPALVTVHQVHGQEAVVAGEPWEPGEAPVADAMVTDRPGIALGILAADCVPVLFVDPDAGIVGAAHAGWKGALFGVLEATAARMKALGAEPGRILAAIGPHISRRSYEVGPEFRDRFIAADRANAAFFAPTERPGHHLFDLGGFVAGRLEQLGLAEVHDAGRDTLTEDAAFFSYRRSVLRGEPDYGRCLSAIVIEG
jgi:YfiH family protein